MIPVGTTTSADFCPVSRFLTVTAVGAATNVKHNRHPSRPPRIRAATFPLRLPHLHPDRLDGDGLHLPLHAHPDRTALYAVRVPQCRVSPRVIVSSVVLSASVPVRSLRSEEHTSELQSRGQLVCRLLLE